MTDDRSSGDMGSSVLDQLEFIGKFVRQTKLSYNNLDRS